MEEYTMKFKLLLLLSCISLAARGMAPLDDYNLFPDLEEFSVSLYRANELEGSVRLEEPEPSAPHSPIGQFPQEQNAVLLQQKGEKRENNEISSSEAEGSTISVKKPKKEYVCGWLGCKKEFSAPNHVKEHERMHAGIRPFSCTFEGCSKAFARSHILKRHLLVHTDEKPFVCKYEPCKSAFNQNEQLIVHERTHTGEKPYVCNYSPCAMAFATSGTLKAHERIHTEEKPYICKHEGCSYAAKKSSDLKRHSKVHRK
jgi:uncharacterized Zn-finger protein